MSLTASLFCVGVFSTLQLGPGTLNQAEVSEQRRQSSLGAKVTKRKPKSTLKTIQHDDLKEIRKASALLTLATAKLESGAKYDSTGIERPNPTQSMESSQRRTISFTKERTSYTGLMLTSEEKASLRKALREGDVVNEIERLSKNPALANSIVTKRPNEPQHVYIVLHHFKDAFGGIGRAEVKGACSTLELANKTAHDFFDNEYLDDDRLPGSAHCSGTDLRYSDSGEVILEFADETGIGEVQVQKLDLVTPKEP